MPSSKKHLLIQSLSWVWTCIKDGWCLNWRFCDWLSCCLLVSISNIFFRVFNIFVCDLPWLLNSWQNNWKANWWRRNTNWRNSCLTSFFKLAACLASSRNHQWLGIFSSRLFSPVFLHIQSLVRSVIQGFSNVLFWLYCVVKQNIWETSYTASYEALNE